MRPYQNYTRAEIARELEKIRREREFIISASGKLEAEMKEDEQSLVTVEKNFWGGSKTVKREKTAHEKAKEIANLGKQLELARTRNKLAKTVQDLNFELHVRNSPELVREFGPGRD
ncbi:hypothetical protein [Micromonospora sp. DT233]|uniref:hypothetical protein n=1 Tax=Micromonospora sp. DT233 TaxID=3393432 RepID=UPI003CF674BF